MGEGTKKDVFLKRFSWSPCREEPGLGTLPIAGERPDSLQNQPRSGFLTTEEAEHGLVCKIDFRRSDARRFSNGRFEVDSDS